MQIWLPHVGLPAPCDLRIHEEIKRRIVPIRIFPNRDIELRMITSIWQDIHEGWGTGRRYLNMDAWQAWEEKLEKAEVETVSVEG